MQRQYDITSTSWNGSCCGAVYQQQQVDFCKNDIALSTWSFVKVSLHERERNISMVASSCPGKQREDMAPKMPLSHSHQRRQLLRQMAPSHQKNTFLSHICFAPCHRAVLPNTRRTSNSVKQIPYKCLRRH